MPKEADVVKVKLTLVKWTLERSQDRGVPVGMSVRELFSQLTQEEGCLIHGCAENPYVVSVNGYPVFGFDLISEAAETIIIRVA